MDEWTAEAEQRFEVPANAQSHFAWLRTRLSVERTLMSWMRTATALIGFGFTMVQFFERLRTMADVKDAARPDMPRYLGMALIAAGTTALLVSIGQYRRVLRYLGSQPFASIAYIGPSPTSTPLLGVATFLSLVGIFAFVSVLLRLG